MTVDEFLKEWNEACPTVEVHTSGSTGTPKALHVEKERMRASARMTCDFLGLQAGDTALLCLPMDYIAGKMMVVRALERDLRLTTVEPTGHPFAADGPAYSLVAMVPLQVWNTLQVPEERARLSRVRHIIIGGSAIDPSLAEALSDFPNNVWSTYGMTETLSHIALRRLNGSERTDWYEPLAGVSVKVNAEGCLVIHAPQICPDALTTNDLAELHPDGRRFRILGRRDNVICSGGLKIQIEEVEQLLRSHTDLPFFITRQADERLGEAVVLLTETGWAKPLQALCEKVLPKYWQPRRYVETPHLPLTATGKPNRHATETLALDILQAEPQNLGE